MERFSTEDLINELKKRDGIDILPLGLYQGYELKGKYGNPDITSGTVILIRDDPIIKGHRGDLLSFIYLTAATVCNSRIGEN